MGSHALNEHSSRSHSLMTIYLEIQGNDEYGSPQVRYGKLNFVDLAGSEKVKESKTTLDTFAEALSINKSLLTLGKCITALADSKNKVKHVPYRDSKLTKLLSDSLNGKGLALMIACISPSNHNLQETLKTVRYAMQARKITNKAVIQLDPEEEMINNFKTEIQILRAENAKLKDILSNDPKYEGLLNSIIIAAAEERRKLTRSRPQSPRVQRSRAPSRHDRVKSTGLSIITSRNFESPRNRGSHSRKSTINTSMNNRKSMSNGLPNRLSQGLKTPKSAAKQRIDELRRSFAPAGKEDSLSRSESPTKATRESSTRAIEPKNSNSPTKATRESGTRTTKSNAISRMENAYKLPPLREDAKNVIRVKTR
jgi:Kinesin motor domain